MKTWTTENAPDETCPKCGSVYSVTVSQLPTKDQDFFNCEVCGFEMRRWNDTRFPSFKLISPGDRLAKPIA